MSKKLRLLREHKQDEKLRQRVGEVSFFWELAGEDYPGLPAKVKILEALEGPGLSDW